MHTRVEQAVDFAPLRGSISYLYYYSPKIDQLIIRNYNRFLGAEKGHLFYAMESRYSDTKILITEAAQKQKCFE